MNLFNAFTGPYALLARIALSAVLAVAFYFFAWYRGDQHGTQKLIDYQAKEATEAVRIAKAREIVTRQVVDHYIQVKGETHVVTQTVEKEIVKYADANTGSCLDALWGELHDQSAINRVPASGPNADGSSRAAPTAAEALETVTANYAACHRTADRLDALQAWVRQQETVK